MSKKYYIKGGITVEVSDELHEYLRTAPSKSKNIFSRMNRQVTCNKHKPVDDGADSAAFYRTVTN